MADEITGATPGTGSTPNAIRELTVAIANKGGRPRTYRGRTYWPGNVPLPEDFAQSFGGEHFPEDYVAFKPAFLEWCRDHALADGKPWDSATAAEATKGDAPCVPQS